MVVVEAGEHSPGVFIGGGGRFTGEIFLTARLGFVGTILHSSSRPNYKGGGVLCALICCSVWGELEPERSHGGTTSLLGCYRVVEWIRAARSGGSAASLCLSTSLG